MITKNVCEKLATAIPRLSRSELEGWLHAILEIYADADEDSRHEMEKVFALERQLLLMGVTPCTQEGLASVWYHDFEAGRRAVHADNPGHETIIKVMQLPRR